MTRLPRVGDQVRVTKRVHIPGTGSIEPGALGTVQTLIHGFLKLELATGGHIHVSPLSVEVERDA